MSGFLLDTCALTELMRPSPNPGVEAWFEQTPESRMYVSVLAIAELYRGIELLPASRRRSELEAKIAEFIDRFGERMLPFDLHDAARWGRLDAQSSSNGRTPPMTDGMLAAVALERHLSIVTRNTRDFDGSGAPTVNPWS